MEAKMPDTAQERLERLLYIFPIASQPGGASLDELSAALGVSVAQVMNDLQEATARAFHLPAGAGDALQITVEENRVQIFAGAHFRRPVRLSRNEALALGIGLRMLAAEVESPERERRLELASRLEHALSAPTIAVRDARSGYTELFSPLRSRAEPEPLLDIDTPEVEWPPAEPLAPRDAGTLVVHIEADAGPLDVQLGQDQFRGVVADSIRDRMRMQVRYLKAGDSEPRERTLEPLRLVYANGRWYVLARDPESASVRVFRLDRMLDARMLGERFERPEYDLSRFLDDAGRVYSAERATTASVRYSPRIARWIRERANAITNEDGSVTLEHKVADPDWLVRHVLQYGSDAQVVEPAELRDHVARAARSLASA
jgi:predicted DNA-binding transcriptional regulator YafY